MEEVQHTELVGGAWRVPKIQEVLAEYVEKGHGKKIPLGQHLNGEEGAAFGAALVGANSSSSFRVKKIFFSDISAHSYSVQVTSLTGEWEKNITTLYPVGVALGGKKKLSFTLEEDFALKLFENGVLMSEYVISGLADKLNGTWKEYNMTGPPKVAVNVNLDSSGIIEVKNPLATVEELYMVNVTKEKKRDTNTSQNTTDDASNTTDDASNTSSEEGTAAASEDVNASGNESADNASGNSTVNNTPVIEYEVVQKQKKKKHEKKLTVIRTDYKPMPMNEAAIAASRTMMDGLAQKEEDAQAALQIKNDLEATIYSSRDKMEMSDFMKVTTEEQRQEVIKSCTEYEEWMGEGSSEKSEYETRLNKLKDLLGPMEERSVELDARADIPDNVKDVLDKITKFHADLKKNQTWVNETKLETATAKVTNFTEWWDKKQASQKDLPLHEAPSYTKKEVMEKLSKLQKDWDKAIKAATKKPKEEKKKDAKKSTNGTNATTSDKEEPAKEEATKEEPMSSDAKVVEEELKAVREKKAAAVENEEFDAANLLKQREVALKAHLETLQKSEL